MSCGHTSVHIPRESGHDPDRTRFPEPLLSPLPPVETQFGFEELRRSSRDGMARTAVKPQPIANNEAQRNRRNGSGGKRIAFFGPALNRCAAGTAGTG